MKDHSHPLKNCRFEYDICHNCYEKFYSIIKNKNVEVEEYKAAKKYFEKYCSNMLDFLELYNRLDCHLLYSCWTAMSTILQSNFELYPENFHTLPAYSFEVAKLALRQEEDELETCIELFDEDNKDIYFKAMGLPIQNLVGSSQFSPDFPFLSTSQRPSVKK